MADLLRYIPTDLSPQGGELKGPCPWCGGTDRFKVEEERSAIGGAWYKCFGPKTGRKGCGRSGDLLTFLQEHDGLTFTGACEEIGLDPDEVSGSREVDTEPTDAERAALRERERRQRHLECERLRQEMSPEERKVWKLMGEPPLRVKRARRRVKWFLWSTLQGQSGSDNSGDNAFQKIERGTAWMWEAIRGLTPRQRQTYRRLSGRAQWRSEERERVRGYVESFKVILHS